MKRSFLFALVGMGVFISSNADTFNANKQGDLASVVYWQERGYTRAPGESDELKVYGNAGNPAFTVGADMSIGSLNIAETDSFIDLTLGNQSLRTITLYSSSVAMQFSKDNANYKLVGGKWYLINKGNVYCGYSGSKVRKDNQTIEFDGCIITNATRFYGAFCDSSTKVKLVNGAEVYADNFYPAYGNFAANSRFEITGGSKLLSINRMIFGDGFEEDWSDSSEVGNNLVEVSGAESLLKIGGESLFGHKVPRNTIKVLNGATLHTGLINMGSTIETKAGHESSIFIYGEGTKAITGGITMGPKALSYGCKFEVHDGANWNSSDKLIVGEMSRDNRAVISNATGSCGTVILGNGAISSNNVFIVKDGAKLEIRSGNKLKVGVNGSSNRVEIINSSVTFGGDAGLFVVGENVSSTRNLLRIAGKNASVAMNTSSNFDPFGAGSGNTLILEDGANIDFIGQYTVARSDNVSNNCFSVRNAVLSPNAHFHLGTSASTGSSRNRVELLDGARAELKSFTMSASSNTLFVSNSTIIASTDTGFRIGYVSKSDDPMKISSNTVVVAGKNALISTDYDFTLSNRSRIHFSIPRKGYAAVPVKVGRFSFDATSSLSVDCEEFCNYTGGGIVLIETVSGIDDTRIGMVLDAANRAENLPTGARFYVSGNNLMFRSPHVKGTVVVIR